MRMAISIKMDSKIRDLMTNDGSEDQDVLERRALAAATLVEARDELDDLMLSEAQDKMYPPPPPTIKITVREGGDMSPQPDVSVTVDPDDTKKDVVRKIKDELRRQWQL